MANYSNFLRILNGVARQVNLSNAGNILEVSGFQLDGSTSGNFQQFANATTTSYSVYWPSAQGSANTYLKNDGSGNLSWAAASGGSVTSVSVVTANGFAGTVMNPTTTPAITLETTVTGVLYGNGTSIAAATAAEIPSLTAYYATLALNNLSAVAINTSLLPGADNTINLGSSAFSWASANIHALNDGSSVVSVNVYSRTLNDTAGAAQLSWSTSGVEINANPLNLNSHQINNVSDPTSPQDAATKHYVDQAISGLEWKNAVQAISVSSNVPLTGSTPLVVDGYTVLNNDSLILAAQTLPAQNGVYTATITGGSYSLAFRSDFVSPQIGWAYLVEDGTSYTNSAWQINAISPNVTFVQFAGPQELVFNAPLARSGNDVSLNYSNGLTVTGGNLEVLASDASILVASGGISVQEDPAGAIVTSGSGILVQLASSNPGLAITSNHLDVKYNPAGAIVASSSGIASQVLSTGGIQITSNSLALLLVSNTALVTGASGLAWQFDNSTIGVNGSNQAYVKNAGITNVQINTNVFDQKTITGGAGTPASVAYAPAIEFPGISGFSPANNVTYALRYGIVQNGETAGQLYPADISTAAPTIYTFTVTAANATRGATYTNNGQTFTVLQTISGGTTLVTSGTGAPTASGTLTKSSGTGDATITFSSFSSSAGIGDLFWVVGFLAAQNGTLTPGSSLTVVKFGNLTLGSGDSAFSANDTGKALFLQSGGINATTTAPSTSGQADAKVGMVTTAVADGAAFDTFLVDIGAPYVY